MYIVFLYCQLIVDLFENNPQDELMSSATSAAPAAKTELVVIGAGVSNLTRFNP
jgi:hypothetical protein